MSTRSPRGYQPLVIDEAPIDKQSLEAKMIRSKTLPLKFFGDLPVTYETEVRSTPSRSGNVIEKQAKKASMFHPIFAIFGKGGRRKKATAKPEFARYMQYLKEGGVWNPNQSRPVIY
uniref:Uncharacterized protein n=1 Tax=Tanacetum cinerariifolium TaxID=118510 RepID=A0A6L2NC97_TANCI|nr:hypothetical protein [Tanacetum cinerariifolium]